MPLQKINLQDKLSQFSDYWNPRIIAGLNGQHVKLVKFQGDFVWHQHDHEDEMFLVLSGELHMELRDQPTIVLTPGECIVIPHGTEHRPVAPHEVHALLFEPATTLNTGNAPDSDLTRHTLSTI